MLVTDGSCQEPSFFSQCGNEWSLSLHSCLIYSPVFAQPCAVVASEALGAEGQIGCGKRGDKACLLPVPFMNTCRVSTCHCRCSDKPVRTEMNGEDTVPPLMCGGGPDLAIWGFPS